MKIQKEELNANDFEDKKVDSVEIDEDMIIIIFEDHTAISITDGFRDKEARILLKDYNGVK